MLKHGTYRRQVASNKQNYRVHTKSAMANGQRHARHQWFLEGFQRSRLEQPQSNFGLTLGRLQADFRPTLGRLRADLGSTLGRLRADFGPTSGRLWADFGLTLGD